MREIGVVKAVQIQRASLKSGQKPYRVYDPAPLLVVDGISLAREGVMGMLADGGQLMDVHHAHHPQSRNTNGMNGVSVGFTSHYQEMRAKFGAHLVDGIAGENILVEAPQRVMLPELGKRLMFENPTTGERAYLDKVIVAAPCVEFSHFVNSANLLSAPLPAETLKATLQFLDDGLRGFYAVARNGMIHSGDRVFALDE